MKKGLLVVLTAAMLFMSAAHGGAAEPEDVLNFLNGSAAACNIVGTTAMLEAYHGPDSGKTERERVDAAYKAAKDCVDTHLPLGREAYRKALQDAPEATHAAIKELYAEWLGYMDSLRLPRTDFSVSSPQQASFQRSINNMRATIDAMP